MVIDRAGARIDTLSKASAGGAAEPRSRPFRHHIERLKKDKDRDETYPDDEAFFDAVAKALGGQEDIVIIGHGHGRSDEAAHLRAHLAKSHKDLGARVIGALAADLAGLTPGELAALAWTVPERA